MLRPRAIDATLLLITTLLYGLIGFSIARYESTSLLLTYSLLFLIYIWVVMKSDTSNTKYWIYASVFFRAMLVFNIPNLSDDFYRFIWDGRLLLAGEHPFAEVPSFYMDHPSGIAGIGTELFSKLNSPDYFTIYPPVAQFIFLTAVKVAPDSIYGSMLVMKSILLAAEIGSLFVIQRLLVQFNIPQKRALLYALNPLVIVELVGNVHLEAILIFFILVSLLLLHYHKLFLSAVTFSLAICAKLIPLMFLPALLPSLGWKKAIRIYAIIAVTCVILFVPLWDREIIYGFQDSLGYYFKKFEFNASIYYLIRQCGYWLYGYNIIQSVGWKLAAISGSIIIAVSMLPMRNSLVPADDRSPAVQTLMARFLIILLAYFLFTTTLHPWYITTLLVLSIFTEFRFVVVWTALIFFTYAGYAKDGFQENYMVVIIEYLGAIGYFTYELLWKRKYTSLLYC